MIRRSAWTILCCGLAMGFGATADAAEVWSETEFPATEFPAVDDITELDLADLLAAPLVQSAARRTQSIEDAPAAMDIFTAEEIVRAGITSLADLLRRVPGMFVVQTNAGRFEVGLRGVSSLGNNRILVLLNGRRLMELDHESPAWSTLPVHVGEIQSIEVLRGPGSIIYGADALSGVINITTKRPLDHDGVDAIFAAGNGFLPRDPNSYRSDLVDNLGSGYATYAVKTRSGKLGAGLTAGWDHVPDWVPTAPATVVHYGEYGFHTAGTLEWRRDPRTNLFVDFRHSQGESQHAVQGLDDAVSIDSNMQSLTAQFRREGIAEHTTLFLATGFHRKLESMRILVARDILSPVSSTNPLDVLTRVERVNYGGQLLAQLDVEVPRARTVFSLGGETTYQLTTQLEGGDYSQIYGAILAQGETHFLHRPELLLNVGLRAEQVGVSSDGKGDAHYLSFSPRVSLVAKLSSNHTIRLSVASAYRMPALGEISNLASSSVLSADRASAPQVYSTWGNFSLRPEQVRSAELGYRGRPIRWLRLDGTIYGQELLDPVRIMRQQVPLAYENAGRQWQSGAEIGIKLQPLATVGVHSAYAFTRTWSTDTDRSTGDFPSHLAQIGIDANIRKARFNIDFAYASTIAPLLMQTTSVGPFFSRPTSNSQLLLNARIGRRILDDHVEIFAQGTNLLAPLRARADLVQYPVGGASPIGFVVLAGVQVRESGSWGGSP
jgi:outer membrane receptor protein involved in Fe transport